MVRGIRLTPERIAKLRIDQSITRQECELLMEVELDACIYPCYLLPLTGPTGLSARQVGFLEF